MKIKRFLEATSLGVNVYVYILNHYNRRQECSEDEANIYSNESISQQFLPFDEVEYKMVVNPFNGGKKTLKLLIIDGCACHQDTEGAIPDGNVFDFAGMYFGKSGDELLELLATKMELNVAERQHKAINDYDKWSFSYFNKPISNTVPEKVVSLQDIYDLIRGDSYVSCTAELRSISDTKNARQYKAKHFDYVTFSGVFTERSEKKLQQHSGLLVLDFDHLPDIVEVKRLLLNDPCVDTAMLFVSPSGDGLKWVVPIEIGVFAHQYYFKAIANYIEHTYQIKVDSSGKDISRACFLPHDKDVYMKKDDGSELKNFDPTLWQDNPVTEPIKEERDNESTIVYGVESWDEVNSIIAEIENKHIDITKEYMNWVRIGFAFANTFGEKGRELFHRVSKLHPKYTHHECDSQYGKCLRSNGEGVSLATFYYIAKHAGINISNLSQVTQQDEVNLPRFNNDIYNQLPEFLQRVCSYGTDQQQKDMLLLGSIVALSSCLSQVHGIYDGKKVHPNLFLFIVGPASAGKGNLAYCHKLVSPIHKKLREESKIRKLQYDVDMKAYKAMKGKDDDMEKPNLPPERMLFIPANNSSTGAYQILSDNDGIGLIFETEADTLTKTFNSDFGDYSDGFRKAFQHEPITYFRRTEKEYVEIELPRLSTLISGTPNQVYSLFPSTENGLYSRFMFYIIKLNPEWRDVFADQNDNEADFKLLGEQFMKLYVKLQQKTISFQLNDTQQKEFSEYFKKKQAAFLAIYGEQFLSIIRRYGLNAYRIAMTLSSIRLVKSASIPEQLTCSDNDLQTALSMADVLFEHNIRIYRRMPKGALPSVIPNKREEFLKQLPSKFDRTAYLEVADKLSIKAKTAEKWVKKFVEGNLIGKLMHNSYYKLTN